MIDVSKKHNCQLAFELQNSHVCEKRSNMAENTNSCLRFWVLGLRFLPTPSISLSPLSLYTSLHPNCTMEKNHTKTANIQPTIASEPIGHILPCSSLDLETERTGKYAIPNDGYIPEQSNACS